MTIGELIKESFSSFIEYKTPKIVHIKSKRVGVFNRILQLTIVAYVIGYAIVYRRGYQEFDGIESSVTTKVKGVLSTETIPDSEFQIEPNHIHYYKRIWDVSDIVVPSSENGAFFVSTNVVITPDQSLGKCPEDPSYEHWNNDPTCNGTCSNGKRHGTGNGVETGKCVEYSNNSKIYVCEINGWCPVERDILPLKNKTSVLLSDTKDFTVLIKNSIQFKFFNVRRRNILETTNSSYLKRCRYNSETDQSCPIFVLKDIVAQSGEHYDQIAHAGGVIGIEINWDCNLDFNLKYCVPKYSFRRLDDPDAQIAKGWNFRYANYYDDRRTLFKAVGIRFVILVNGKAGKFNLIPLLINVGSGLGLLAITTIICDIVVLYFNKSDAREYYNDKKYQYVDSINELHTCNESSHLNITRRRNRDESDPIISEMH